MSEESTTPTGAESQAQPTDGEQNGQDSSEATRQTEIDKIVQARLTRAQKAWEKQLQEKLDSHASSHLEAWREEQGLTDDAIEQFQSRDKVSHEIRTLKGEATKAKNAAQAEREMREKYEQHIRGYKVEGAIFAEAAATANNPKEIVALLRDRVKVDIDSDFSVFVVDETGEPTGQTVGEMVKDYLDKNDHHMRPVGGRGAGSVVRAPGTSADGGGAGDTRDGRLAALKRGGFG